MLLQLEEVCTLCVTKLKQGNKILFAGNGGSAADAQHLAGELISKFNYDREALPGIALSTDTSILTAVSNDYGYEEVFARQIQGLGNEGDILLVISTSGNSASILRAIEAAKRKKMLILGFTGESGGKMKEHCDYIFKVPSSETPRIQEIHIKFGHILCELIEDGIFKNINEARN